MPPWLSPRSFLHLPSPKIITTPPSTFVLPRTLLHGRLPSRTPIRLVSQWGPPRPQYNRFGNAQNLYTRWRTSPNFRYGVGAVGLGSGGIYYYNLEEVPISGRRRFNCISPAWEEQMANSQYEGVMQQFGRQVLPPGHPYSRMVNKVLARLIPAAGLDGQKWEVKVIDDPEQKNAFVLPGGKVFVFSGILPICAGEDGLAAVLGHEIAHNVAHHTGEKLSQAFILLPIALLLTYAFDISGSLSQWLLSIALERPGSRKMESEADYIGLLMMAQACYNPSAAVGLWGRMAKAEQYAPPQFLSTHPASKNRMTVIKEWLPQAEQKSAESECGNVSGHMNDFRNAFGHGDDGFL